MPVYEKRISSFVEDDGGFALRTSLLRSPKRRPGRCRFWPQRQPLLTVFRPQALPFGKGNACGDFGEENFFA